MRLALSIRNLSMRSDKSRKLLSAGHEGLIRHTGSCFDSFPYLVIYREQGPNTIQVLAIAHTSRKP